MFGGPSARQPLLLMQRAPQHLKTYSRTGEPSPHIAHVASRHLLPGDSASPSRDRRGQHGRGPTGTCHATPAPDSVTAPEREEWGAPCGREGLGFRAAALYGTGTASCLDTPQPKSLVGGGTTAQR